MSRWETGGRRWCAVLCVHCTLGSSLQNSPTPSPRWWWRTRVSVTPQTSRRGRWTPSGTTTSTCERTHPLCASVGSFHVTLLVYCTAAVCARGPSGVCMDCVRVWPFSLWLSWNKLCVCVCVCVYVHVCACVCVRGCIHVLSCLLT